MRASAAEAYRIFRHVKATFADGSRNEASGFVAVEPGLVVTCAHVVSKDDGTRATHIQVLDTSGRCFDATLREVEASVDLATLQTADTDRPGVLSTDELPSLGENLIYAGQPIGTSRAGIFSGIVSVTGPGLLTNPPCDLIQINGMINNGNSGGPVLVAGETRIIGTVTAKYVPLLQEIDRLRDVLKDIPQIPRDVGIGQIDFAGFFNLTIRSLHRVSAVLRLVQVGTGWAVPARYLGERRLL